jgi:hypothetical protein
VKSSITNSGSLHSATGRASSAVDLNKMDLPPVWKVAMAEASKARASFRVAEATKSDKDKPADVVDKRREVAANKASVKELGMAILSQGLGYATYGSGSGYSEQVDGMERETKDNRMSARGVRRLWLGLSSMFTNVREAGNDIHRDIRSLEMTDAKVHRAAAKAIASIEQSLAGKQKNQKGEQAAKEVLDSVKKALSTSGLDSREQRAILMTVHTVLDIGKRAESSDAYKESLKQMYLSAPSEEHRRAYAEAVGRWRAGLKSLVTSAVSRTASALSAASLGAVGAVGLASAAESLLQRRYNITMERFCLSHRLRTMTTAGNRELQAFFDTDSSYEQGDLYDEHGVRRADAPKSPVDAYCDARERFKQESSSVADRATAVRNLIRNGYHILRNASDYDDLVDAGKVRHSAATAKEYARLGGIAGSIEEELGGLFDTPGASRSELIENIENLLCSQDPFSDAARGSFVKEIYDAERLVQADFLRESEQSIEKNHSLRTWQGTWQLASRFGLNALGNSLAVVAAGLRASAEAVQGLQLIPIGQNAEGQTEQLVSEFIRDRVSDEFSRVTGLKRGLGALPGMEHLADSFSATVGTWVSDAAVAVNKLVADFGIDKPFQFLSESPNFNQQWDISSGKVEAKGLSFFLDRGVGASGLTDSVVGDVNKGQFATVVDELRKKGFHQGRFYDFGADSWFKKSIDGLHTALWAGAGLLSLGVSFQSAKVAKAAPAAAFVPPIPEMVQVVEPQGYQGVENSEFFAEFSTAQALRAPALPSDPSVDDDNDVHTIDGAVVDEEVRCEEDIRTVPQRAPVIMPVPVLTPVSLQHVYGNKPMARGIFAVANEREKCLITPVKRTSDFFEFSKPEQLDRRDVWIADTDSGKDLSLAQALVTLNGQHALEGAIASENGVPFELLAFQWEQFRNELNGNEQLMFVREQLYAMGVEKSAGFGAYQKEFRFDRTVEFAQYLKAKQQMDELEVVAAAVRREQERNEGRA